jgi:hypothetical protein
MVKRLKVKKNSSEKSKFVEKICRQKIRQKNSTTEFVIGYYQSNTKA